MLTKELGCDLAGSLPSKRSGTPSVASRCVASLSPSSFAPRSGDGRMWTRITHTTLLV